MDTEQTKIRAYAKELENCYEAVTEENARLLAEVERMQAALDKAVALVKALEYSYFDERGHSCPCCFAHAAKKQHVPDCELAEFLADAKKE